MVQGVDAVLSESTYSDLPVFPAWECLPVGDVGGPVAAGVAGPVDESVHALAGMMDAMNAAKGVLVATSWIGKASRDFAARNGNRSLRGAVLDPPRQGPVVLPAASDPGNRERNQGVRSYAGCATVIG